MIDKPIQDYIYEPLFSSQIAFSFLVSLYSLDFILSYNYGNSVSSPDLNVAYFVPIRVSLNTPFGNTRIKQTVDEGRDPTR